MRILSVLGGSDQCRCDGVHTTCQATHAGSVVRMLARSALRTCMHAWALTPAVHKVKEPGQGGVDLAVLVTAIDQGWDPGHVGGGVGQAGQVRHCAST